MGLSRRKFLAGTVAAAAAAALPAVAVGEGVSLVAAAHPIDPTHRIDALLFSFRQTKEIYAANILSREEFLRGGWDFAYDSEQELWLDGNSLEPVEIELVHTANGLRIGSRKIT